MDYLTIQFMDINLTTSEAAQLRGYFGQKYIDNDLYHNHSGSKTIYRYPEIQYKVIGHKPMVLGINEGAKALAQTVLFEESINIGTRVYPIAQCTINSQHYQPQFLEDMKNYRFLTPWMALNQKNYGQYTKLKPEERKSFLERILTGNILSFFKGIKYHAEHPIQVVLTVDDLNVKLKNKMMVGFKGSFKTNLLLPDYIGLGKSVSRGLGAIKGE